LLRCRSEAVSSLRVRVGRGARGAFVPHTCHSGAVSRASFSAFWLVVQFLCGLRARTRRGPWRWPGPGRGWRAGRSGPHGRWNARAVVVASRDRRDDAGRDEVIQHRCANADVTADPDEFDSAGRRSAVAKTARWYRGSPRPPTK